MTINSKKLVSLLTRKANLETLKALSGDLSIEDACDHSGRALTLTMIASAIADSLEEEPKSLTEA